MRKFAYGLFVPLVLFFLSAEYAMAQSPPYGAILSVTYYDFPAGNAQRLEHLRQELPGIKQAGFNTVWLVSAWAAYNPKPLANPPEYSNGEFEILRQTLAFLKENHMSAILGLNYLGKGWAPDGIDACGWATDPNSPAFKSFVTYAHEFLSRIKDYSDMTYILVFTENAQPCGDSYGNAEKNAEALRQTIGNLPDLLSARDRNLRGKFRIGYHDFNLVNLGWANGKSPINDPIKFDFVSMVGYEFPFQEDFKKMSDEEIKAEMAKRALRFKRLYPGTPLIVGEYGYRACENGDQVQADKVSAVTEFALKNNYGLNLWGWRPLSNGGECTNPAAGGLAITNEDGSLKPVVGVLRELFAPIIVNAGLTTTFNHWAVWVQGKNLSGYLSVNLFDKDRLWNGPIGTTISEDYTWLSFRLPGNIPPSNCNTAGNPCSIKVQLENILSGAKSNLYDLNLPPTEPDQTKSIFDIIAWRRLWAQGKPEADTNGDGRANILDYLAILREWLK